MTHTEDIALSAIYGAALGSMSWQGALQKSCDLLNSDKGILFTENVSSADGGIWEASAIESAAIDSYQRHYSHIEPLAPAAHDRSLNRGQILTIPTLMNEREFRRSEFFNDFWKPQGINEFVGYIEQGSAAHNAPYIHLTFFRNPKQGRFDQIDEHRLARLRFHLRHALALREHVSANTARNPDSIQSILETISCPAFVIDRTLKLTALNASAEKLAAQGRFLSRHLNRCRLSGDWSVVERDLNELFKRAFSSAPRCRAVMDNRSQSAALVSIHPLPEIASNGTCARALVLLRPCDLSDRGADLGAVCEAFGLTTREAEICLRLLNGETTREIGNRLSIGRETLKTHLGNIFVKFGVHSQVQLAVRLTRLTMHFL